MKHIKFDEIKNFLYNTDIPLLEATSCDYVAEAVEKEEDWTLSTQYDINYGASKFVISPKNKQYVIKIPFYCGICYDKDRSCYLDSIDFHLAKYPLSRTKGWNYCKSEEEYYLLSREEKIENIFAQTMLVGSIEDIPIYIQEKCKDFEGGDRLTYDELDKSESFIIKN